MSTKVTIIDPKDFQIEESKATEIVSGLQTVLAERQILEDAYVDVIGLEITTENLPTFKELRLKIVKNRTQGIDAWHKTNKDFYLRGGQFVDAIKRKESFVNEQMESKLLEAEKHFENLEKKRLFDLNESRKELLSNYVMDTFGLELSGMEQDVFDAYLSTKKAAFEKAETERIEAEQKRIADEKAEAERIEAQRIENERLKTEADAREAQIKKEREAAEKALADERAKAKAEADKLAAEKEKELAIEREKQSQIAAELKAKEDAELKAKQEAEKKAEADKKEAEKLAKAPVKKQLSVWVNSFEISEIPIKDNEAAKLINAKFEAFKLWALEQVNAI